MTQITKERQAEVLAKEQILLRAKIELKNEFYGIDRVIDEVVDTISAWYLFPDLQEKPLIINLWGLTGVGKSSLVKRLSSLLEFDKQFYHFDLGDNGQSEFVVKRQLEKIYEQQNGFPVMLALDEFQHARTIDSNGHEVDSAPHRVIWQLLDSGKFSVSRSTFYIEDIYTLILHLRYFLQNGVTVTEGVVTGHKSFFLSKLPLSVSECQPSEKAADKLLFVPSHYYENIFDMARELFDDFFSVREKLLSLDGPGTIRFLQEVLAHGNSPKEVDCSKGLIFVLGNLDEAYKMSRDQNADVSADEFHEESLTITVPDIKHALKKRFRTEQIGRLGNHHIIYPAMNRKTFQQIIASELEKVARKARESFGLELNFDDSLHQLIYREGVYPTHGTRPVFTTIYQMVQSRLGAVVSEILTRNLTRCSVRFNAHSKGVLAEFCEGEKVRHSRLFEQEFALGKLRESKRDDVQAITAVHESGHAILAAVLLRVVPEVVYSNTTVVGSSGFAYIRNKWKYVSRKEITLRLAMFLGGMVAEKLVFGAEHVTTGASSDIQRATAFVTEMLRYSGMGSQLGHFNAEEPATNDTLYDYNYQLNQEAREWISKAATLAEDTLRKQEKLLLEMSDLLSDQRQLNQSEIIDLLKLHAVDFDTETLITDGDLIYYRKHLKQKVQQLSIPVSEKGPLDRERVVLNRKDEH